jgi:hypothetical protein
VLPWFRQQVSALRQQGRLPTAHYARLDMRSAPCRASADRSTATSLEVRRRRT